MKRFLLVFTALAALSFTATAQPPKLSTEQWRRDIDFLAKELPSRHVAWDRMVDQKAFDAAVSNLRRHAGELKPHEIITGMMGLTAMAGDESTLIPVFRAPVNFNMLPLQTYWFEDGLYIVGAPGPYAHLIGMRVSAIGGRDIDEAYDLVAPVIPSENKYGKRWWFSIYGMMPEVLAARGVTRAPGAVDITTEDSLGTASATRVEPVSFSIFAASFFLDRPGRERPPMFTNMRRENYWCDFDKATASVIVRVNQVRDIAGGPSVEDFASQVSHLIDAVAQKRVIVDLRGGGGGSGHLLAALTDMFETHPELQEPGSLFALIGSKTSGTVLEFASMLESRTPVIFVGTPTAEGPNTVGDSNTFSLPESGIPVFYTSVFWPTSIPQDRRRWIQPDVPVVYHYNDYARGDDPWMDAAVTYSAEPASAASVAPDVVGQLQGRYAFSSSQILEITGAGNRLRMIITDAIPGSFFRVATTLRTSSQVRFETDIRDVLVEAAIEPGEAVDQLFIDWKGHEMTVERLPRGVRYPMELIADGKYAEGADALTRDRANADYYRHNAVPYLYELANSLVDAADYDNAAALQNVLVHLDPQDPGAWVAIAETLALSGRRDEAIEHCRRALIVDPGNAAATELMRRLQGNN